MGELESSIKHYRIAIGKNNKKANWFYNLGLLLYDLGDVDAAQDNYRITIDLDPMFDSAYFALGTLQMQID